MEMRLRVAIARKRRVKILAEWRNYQEKGWTQTKLAEKHGYTPQWIGVLIRKAIIEEGL